MINRLISISFLAFFVISSAFFFLIALVIWILTVAFDRRLVLLQQFSCFWASVYLWAMPAWQVTTEGREKIRTEATYVVVSNHQSMLDILVAYRLFFHFKWVSKADVFRLPLVGWNMILNRYIKLKRGDKESVKQMFRDAEATLAEGSSIYLFPEGTRSRTGAVKPFKPGAFVLAQTMKCPILPIVIDGTCNALPKRSLTIQGKHRIRVKVLEEIPYEAFADLPVEELAEEVRWLIAAHLIKPSPFHLERENA